MEWMLKFYHADKKILLQNIPCPLVDRKTVCTSARFTGNTGSGENQ
jgi:hypothetical protein